MPRYYFNVFNGEVTEDEQGAELADLAAAREFAIAGIRSLACDSLHKGHLNLDHYILVADEAGATLMTVAFREAFTITGR